MSGSATSEQARSSGAGRKFIRVPSPTRPIFEQEPPQEPARPLAGDAEKPPRCCGTASLQCSCRTQPNGRPSAR
ncbi:hypothetical protein ACFPRL_12425 [Pseudoclavibacter helvolus]